MIQKLVVISKKVMGKLKSLPKAFALTIVSALSGYGLYMGVKDHGPNLFFIRSGDHIVVVENCVKRGKDKDDKVICEKADGHLIYSKAHINSLKK